MRIIFYLLITLCGTGTFAQELYVDKRATFITEFPFKQLSGGVILIHAGFNDIAQPFSFILDTGSGAISLDSSTAAEFKIPHVSSGRSVNGIAGIREVDFAQHNRLTLPGLTIDSLDFYINDYDILSMVYGEKIDGIIGYSFFSRYIVNIDFDSLRIKLFTPGKYLYPQGGTMLHPLFTALPIQPVQIKDARELKANFYFDTGAGLCFLISKQFNQDSAVVRKKRKPVSIQVQGLGGKKEMQLSVIKQLQIGPYKFRKVPTNILDDEYNATSYPFICGLIGNDLLRRFNLTLNYPRREIHLHPNGHFRDGFDYSYTGMNMYYIDGKIFADDVIKGSPADKGGLKKDDIIMGVNNNFSNDITTYKNLMQNVGDKITLVLMRANQPLIVTFKVGRIF